MERPVSRFSLSTVLLHPLCLTTTHILRTSFPGGFRNNGHFVRTSAYEKPALSGQRVHSARTSEGDVDTQRLHGNNTSQLSTTVSPKVAQSGSEWTGCTLTAARRKWTGAPPADVFRLRRRRDRGSPHLRKPVSLSKSGV